MPTGSPPFAPNTLDPGGLPFSLGCVACVPREAESDEPPAEGWSIRYSGERNGQTLGDTVNPMLSETDAGPQFSVSGTGDTDAQVVFFISSVDGAPDDVRLFAFGPISGGHQCQGLDVSGEIGDWSSEEGGLVSWEATVMGTVRCVDFSPPFQSDVDLSITGEFRL